MTQTLLEVSSLVGLLILSKVYGLSSFQDPLTEYFYISFVTVPFLDRDPKAIDVIQVILESALLRREKSMTDRDGNPIIQLPDKQVPDWIMCSMALR